MTMRPVRFIPLLLLLLLILAFPTPSSAQVAVGISVRIGPPALPVYPQPLIPGPGYIWVPGYWANGPGGYYWVPGTWVLPPTVGVLWTPGYWGWANGLYIWHGGYWGPHVGFYGGINYGYGYTGVGFVGGYWSNGAYYYNRAVTNVNTTIIQNTYNTTVVNNNTNVSRVSYNGGTGGTTARPTTSELAATRESHVPPTAVQTQHEHAASTNRAMLASANHGQPAVAATVRPGAFQGEGVVASRAAEASRPVSGSTQPVMGQAKSSATGVAQANNRAATNASAARPPAQNHGQAHPGKGQPGTGQQPRRQGQSQHGAAQSQPGAKPPRQEQPREGGHPPQNGASTGQSERGKPRAGR